MRYGSESLDTARSEPGHMERRAWIEPLSTREMQIKTRVSYQELNLGIILVIKSIKSGVKVCVTYPVCDLGSFTGSVTLISLSLFL